MAIAKRVRSLESPKSLKVRIARFRDPLSLGRLGSFQAFIRYVAPGSSAIGNALAAALSQLPRSLLKVDGGALKGMPFDFQKVHFA